MNKLELLIIAMFVINNVTNLHTGKQLYNNFVFFSFQDDHRAFRRQLEDKRPVVESNLLSGRQYIANEPPLSDTSDSEGK